MTCLYNYITKLPKLPDSLEKLECYNNQLYELPKLPSGLTYLDCGGNLITELPDLPPKLETLACYRNKIKHMPDSIPSSLKIFWIKYNPIKIFPDSFQNFKIELDDNSSISHYKKTIHFNFSCGSFKKNLSDEWDDDLDELETLNEEDNPMLHFIMIYCKMDTKLYVKYRKAVEAIENWYLECKYNPKYKYCQKRVMNEYNEFYDS